MWLLVIIDVPYLPNMLANLLVFATGLDVIPPLGIDPSPSLQFDHPEDDDNHYMRGVPFANTCANCLHIPVLPDYELPLDRHLRTMMLIFRMMATIHPGI